MSNIQDYVKWRSDITFAMSPLNEVDSLIFAELAYLPFEHFVPSISSGEKMLLSEVADKFFDVFDEDKSIGAIIPGSYIIRLFRTLSKTKRYSDVKMWAFVNDISKDKEKQFSAICFSFYKKNTFIAFRGTDDTLVGWKENLNMALYTPIPSQIDGRLYVEQIAQLTKDKLTIGGHSKGGNIAVYSGLSVNKKVQKRIQKIYNFDGPGFTDNFIKTVVDTVAVQKIVNYLPKSSIIGRIFDFIGTHYVVKSFNRGVQQHDGFSWDVLGAEFVQVNSFDKDSDDFHDMLKNWVIKMPEADRNKFVEAFYRVATSTNASTLSDIMINKTKFFFSVLSSSGEDKKVLIDGVKKLLKEKNTVKGTGTKPKALPKGALDDDDTPIESVYFSPGNKKNK